MGAMCAPHFTLEYAARLVRDTLVLSTRGLKERV
jgi:hypothetical protein